MKFFVLSLLLISGFIGLSQDSLKMSNIELPNLPELYLIESDLGYYFSENLPIIEHAKFPGGISALIEYVTVKLNLDSMKIENPTNKIYVEFTVDTLGKIINPIILRGINNEIDNKCLSIIQRMPDWIPATNRNGNVSSRVRLPMIIEIEK